MQRREWYMIDYDAIVGSKGDLVYYTYEAAKAKAGKYPVRKVVVDETWEEPEEEWVRPTDEDARHRPMVQVGFSLINRWQPAKLLAVTVNDADAESPWFVAEDCDGDIRIYDICRMKASERNKR